ncbi:L,D-transpeptidase family protein [Bacillus thermotolerans]|uniref:L,D-transpeptidase family protein n=1 Tax=Bacillus thermotolerans TaxID=1221996 RepID=UPI00057FA58B|nr:L,D-transpeptidase family protein [Bacillus thermotolerans]KKB34299.1 Protein erfK/srfK precursor [Bacillus thermotolerans]
MNHTVKPGETLSSIAADYRVSVSRLLAANPGINPNLIYPGQRIRIPGLPSPSSSPYDIHVSLSNRRLTLRRNGVVQKTYPVGVGRMVSQTPVGDFVIINKAPNPGGPYGTMWMSLSKQHYGIHGTNDPSSIGKFVSRGCIRMHNRDVEELARTVPIGTAVHIRP